MEECVERASFCTSPAAKQKNHRERNQEGEGGDEGDTAAESLSEDHFEEERYAEGEDERDGHGQADISFGVRRIDGGLIGRCGHRNTLRGVPGSVRSLLCRRQRKIRVEEDRRLLYSVFRGFLVYVVDDENGKRALFQYQLEPELLLHGLGQGK